MLAFAGVALEAAFAAGAGVAEAAFAGVAAAFAGGADLGSAGCFASVGFGRTAAGGASVEAGLVSFGCGGCSSSLSKSTNSVVVAGGGGKNMVCEVGMIAMCDAGALLGVGTGGTGLVIDSLVESGVPSSQASPI